MAKAPFGVPAAPSRARNRFASAASVAALSLVANGLPTSRGGIERESGGPESTLRGVLDLCATVVPVSRSCQPGFFESRRRSTIHTAFNTGIANRTRTIRSLSAIRPRPAGRPSALATIRRPVSFRPGVVPKRRFARKRNTSAAKPPVYMDRAKSANHRSSSRSCQDLMEIAFTGALSIAAKLTTTSARAPIDQSIASAAIRRPGDAGSRPSSDCSFTSSTASSLSVTRYQVSHYPRKRESKEPEIVSS